MGIGLKPGTDVDAVLPYAPLADMLLVMTVEPGFGGQKFMADMMPKVARLRQEFPMVDIEVDGGVSPANIDQCAKVSVVYITPCRTKMVVHKHKHSRCLTTALQLKTTTEQCFANIHERLSSYLSLFVYRAANNEMDVSGRGQHDRVRQRRSKVAPAC